ncbi:MAG: hypothetical protein JSW39_27615 [Desulfobacterales bacterium]|nr:MAG: hypothetical protein JSW39_27615 [Desulfobacterales bacterium]
MHTKVESAIISLSLLFLGVFATTGSGLAQERVYVVRDVLEAMETITKGRVMGPDENPFITPNRFVVTKSSEIPGKAVTELPGLVYGKLDAKVEKIGVVMTINEGVIELAGGLGVNVLVAHHPFADATNFGGVRLRDYCDLYGLNLFEAHEAFHGRHPGIAFLHGYKVQNVSINYGGDPGNVMFLGKAFPDTKTLGDILQRLENIMEGQKRDQFLALEREFWGKADLQEAVALNKPLILLGSPDRKVENIIHIFPHTGFKPEHLEKVYRDNPNLDTVICSISRVRPDHALVQKAAELGLNFLLGNSHPQEIYENGMPLGKALTQLLPGVPVLLLDQRVTAIPVAEAGNAALQAYGDQMAAILTAK